MILVYGTCEVLPLNTNQRIGAHDGRVAIVTGGSQGIGKGIALQFASHGSTVVVHGLTLDHATAVAEEIVLQGGRASAVAGPIDDPQTSHAEVEHAVARYGAIDTLVTSAGIQRYGDVVSTSEETWDEVFNVNVKGVFLAAQAALPHLR
jgi:NAD(P)-dependent dehydrogenase (short-subunit alcohol dehydrogenase family)